MFYCKGNFLTIEQMKKSRFVKIMTKLFNKYIRKDFRIKAAFFFVGLILWFNINLDKEFEINDKIPIKINGMQKDLTLLNPIPKYAKVKLKSQGKALVALDLNSSLYFDLDLTTVTKHKLFKLDPVSFINTTSKSIELLSVHNPFVDVKLDSLIHRKVPIVVNQKFKTVPGYTRTGSFYQDPDSILISGPASRVRNISEINTEFKPELTLDFDYKTTLNLVLSNMETINYTATQVKLYQKIVRLGSNTMKMLIKQQNVPIGKKFLIDPIYVEVIVSGPVSELQKVTEEDFFVYVNYNQIDRSKMLSKVYVDTNIKLNWKVSSEYVKVIE